MAMTLAGGGAAIFRFSTDEFPVHARDDAVREMHERSTLPTKPEPVEPLSDKPLTLNITQWALPGMGIMSGTLRGVRTHVRPRPFAPTGVENIFLDLSWGGASVIKRCGERTVVSGGDASVAIRGAKGYTIARPGQVQFMGLRLPLVALAPLVSDLDRLEVRMIYRGNPALKLLRRYVRAITKDGALTTFELQRAAVSHVYDLSALALATTTNASQLAQNRGVRAARLEVIKADISAHLDDEGLGVVLVAYRQGITVRYLQKLFEADGTSFSEFVISQRLAKAYHLLTSPASSKLTISSIAYNVGFKDLSYFNRAFRRRYGLTPSDVRHRQAGMPDVSPE